MKFEGRPGREVPTYFRDRFGVDVSEDTVERALDGIRAQNKKKKPRGGSAQQDAAHTEVEPDADREPPGIAVWTDWLRLDEHRLGVRKVLVRIANDGFELSGVVAEMESMPGIRQVIETKEQREIFAVALLRTEEEEDDLRARLLEHVRGHPVSVSVIHRESHAPTALTWLRLAQEEANVLQLERRSTSAENDHL
jgi:hypothetical protein